MQQRRFHILFADENAAALQHGVNRLKRADHVVAGAGSADEATWWLSGWPVDLVMTPPKFGRFTGVQLVLRAREQQPGVAGLVTEPGRSGSLTADAARHDVHLAAADLDSAEFVAEVAAILACITHRQRWPRKDVSPALSMHVGTATGTLMDVSYGGLKFELPEDAGSLRSPLELDVPRADLRVPVEVVWSAPGHGRGSVFGASVVPEPAHAAEWRAFVDRVA